MLCESFNSEMRGGEAGKSAETKPDGPARAEAGALFAEALTATKLKVKDKLIALVTARPEIANLQDLEGKSRFPAKPLGQA